MQTSPIPTPQQSQEQIKPKTIRKKTQTYQAAIAIKLFLAACAKHPVCREEIIKITGLTNSTVSRYVALYHRGPDNLIYVSKYSRRSDRGQWIEHFSLGYKMPDVLKPKPMTQTQYHRRYMAKKAGHTQITHTPTGIIHVSTS